MLSLICPWHCSHGGTENGAACLSCHLKLQKHVGNVGCPCQAPFAALLLKCECLHLAGSQKGLSLKAVAQPHLPMAVPAQRHRDWGCLLVLPPQSSKVTWKCWCPCQAPFASLLLKCERLQIAGSQKGLAWKAVAQPHLPMALFARRHREWGCLLILPLETSNACWEWWCPCQAPITALLRKCERLQIASSQKGLAWKAVAQPHLPMAVLAQRHREWGCLLVLPPQTSNIAWDRWCTC